MSRNYICAPNVDSIGYERGYSDLWVVMSLFYYSEENYFVDEDGFVIYDPFAFITPGELSIFKRDQETCYFPRGEFGVVEVLYPEIDG